jgi:hypothetical protein
MKEGSRREKVGWDDYGAGKQRGTAGEGRQGLAFVVQIRRVWRGTGRRVRSAFPNAQWQRVAPTSVELCACRRGPAKEVGSGRLLYSSKRHPDLSSFSLIPLQSSPLGT